MRLVILGGSGSGKSTQAQRLCRHFDFPLISTGEIIQEAIKSHLELTDYLEPYMAYGELETDEMVIDFIRKRILEPDAKVGWVLEGYPRTAFAAEQLDVVLDNLEQKLDWAIYLQVPEAVMVSRSKARFQPDDQPEIVQRRVELFYDRTIPILEYYDRRRCLLTINGDQPPELVQQNIVTLLSIP